MIDEGFIPEKSADEIIEELKQARTFYRQRDLLFRTLLYQGEVGNKNVNTVFNTSFNLSCIHPDCLKGLANAQKIGVIRNIAIPGKMLPVQITQVTCLDFYIDNVLLSDEFLVVPELNQEVVIGAATIRKWRIKLNFEDDRVEVDPK